MRPYLFLPTTELNFAYPDGNCYWDTITLSWQMLSSENQNTFHNVESNSFHNVDSISIHNVESFSPDNDLEHNSIHNVESFPIHNVESFSIHNVEKFSNLELVNYLMKHGLPKESELRAKIFQKFRQTKQLRSEYPITYQGLKQCVPNWGEYYTDIQLSENLSGVISGSDVITDIKNSKYSEDMKALLLFLLP